MSDCEYAVMVCPVIGGGEDRAVVLDAGEELVVVLADGAGGTSYGAEAAQAVVDAATMWAGMGRDWMDVLAELDREPKKLAGGQSTAVILSVACGASGDAITGASVGDSGAWLMLGETTMDLTAGQVQKPLIGSGALPTAVRATPLGQGTLLVASDGLFKHADAAEIAAIASGPDLQRAANALVDLVRLETGSLKDDVAIVLVRKKR